MYEDLRMILAANVAAGLLSKHGVDHGGVSPDAIAEKSVAIADAIYSRCGTDAGEFREPTMPAGENAIAKSPAGNASGIPGNNLQKGTADVPPAEAEPKA